MTSDVAQFPVVDVPDRHRFEIHDGDRVAGFTDYRRRGSLIAFIHTEVADEYEGKGAASRLISAALEVARAQGLSVLPFCPFVRGYIAKHPDRYLDLVPAHLREDFELPATPGVTDG
ncbi:MAG TPA: GNAT family N-acetyltransferase [Solirubrobacterales bacterium]